MRRLVLLALVTLATFPLSAHDHWDGSRRVVVFEAPRCAPRHHGEQRHWREQWDHGACERRHDGDDERLFLRPLAPPFRGRVMVRIR